MKFKTIDQAFKVPFTVINCTLFGKDFTYKHRTQAEEWVLQRKHFAPNGAQRKSLACNTSL